MQAVWVFFVFAMGLFSATQFAAYQFNYHSTLGVNAHGLYPPWMILVWAAKWHARYSDVFMKAGSMGVLVAGIGMVGLGHAKAPPCKHVQSKRVHTRIGKMGEREGHKTGRTHG